MDCKSFRTRFSLACGQNNTWPVICMRFVLEGEAYKIDLDSGNHRSYLSGTDFHHRRPGSATLW